MGTANDVEIDEKNIGIIPRVIKEIFEQIENRKKTNEFILKVSFLEIYNEDIHDLLDKTRNK